MDSETNVLERCKPLFVKLTRITNSEISNWKQGKKHIDRSYLRRRSLSVSQEGGCKQLKSKKSKKCAPKCTLSDSDGGLSQSHISSNHDDIMISNDDNGVDKTNSAPHEKRSESIDSVTLPKNNIPINDKSAWKYKRKRRKISQPIDRPVQTCENNDDSKNIMESSNSKQPTEDHDEAAHVDLSKEIKIVSSRLEDSDDPQVERWRSKKKTSLSFKSRRLLPKSNRLDCTVCSVIFDSKEELSNHIFKHTQRELQEAYKVAKTKLRESENNGDVGNDSGDDLDDRSDSPALNKNNQPSDMESPSRKTLPQITSPASLSTDTLTKESSAVPMVICSCHTEHHSQNDPSVQIEMVLFCETCHVLFRRSECFETHYRFSSICNADRTKGRTPKLFCSTCRVIFNTLSNMRRHLEEHASENFHRTVTFVCNICRVVFFGVGTVFCTHWFNHEKDPTFVASRYSFPKLCVSTQGTKPSGSASDEQYLFVAEYVCRSCKFQFSSECELLQHTAKDCKGPAIAKGHLQSKTTQSNSIMTNTGSSKSTSEMDVSKNYPVPFKPLDMINKWICEFCDESYPSRDAFEEHSSKHLQDDGYPGYSGVYQTTATTAYICNVCRNVHKTVHDLMKHWVTHEVIKFICTVCNERCSSYSSFETHISLACWKSKPDCRVWFNRQQHPCKICNSMYKTAEELAHHYAFEHVSERNTIPILSSDPPRSVVETPPTSGTSSIPQLEKNCSKQQAIVKSSDSSDNQTEPVNFALQDSNLAEFSNTFASDIENSITDKPIQELSTIKITIPNLLEKPTIVCEARSIIDPVTSSKSIQEKMSGICELASETTLNNKSSSVNNDRNAAGSSMIIETPIGESRDPCKVTANITEANTCVRRTSVISGVTANLPTGNDNAGLKNTSIRDSLLLQPITKDSPHFGLSISSNSSYNSPTTDDESELNNDNDGLAIIIEPENAENLCIISDKESEMSKPAAPEIIEITNKLAVSTNTHVENQIPHEMKSKQLENSELKYLLESKCSPVKHQSLYQKPSNNENNAETAIQSNNKTDVCSIDPDGSKPRGFLRVKKFTELQAVRNYICHLCAAAFDNVMSLDEHVIAHERRPVENEKHPRMMAALILPQVESSTAQRESVLLPPLSLIPRISGNRILPHIPQQVVNANGRKASTPARGQVNNKSHNSPTIQNSTNTQNAIQEQPPYRCPLCLQSFRCEDFANHLAVSHSIRLSDININSDGPINPHKATNAISKKEQEGQTRKICKYTAHDRGTIDEQARFHHLNEIRPNTNIVPTNNLASVQHNDLIVSANGRMNPNVIPPFKCSLCTNYQYNTIKELSQHVQTVHYSIIREGISYPFVCNICYLPFQTYNELIIHRNSHQNTRWT